MERGVRLNGEDYCYYYSSGDGGVGVASSSTASPLPRVGGAAAAAATCDGTLGGGGMNYIEHHVTKFDTLVGVAIRYGVEVADVKRINGLITDLQMFARKTLKIPLPGRHPPSPCLSNGFDVQGGGFTGITPSKGLALRPNPASRTASLANGESSMINPIPFVLGDSPIADNSNLDRVRKSSSASNLQDSDSSSSSSTLASLWPTSKWSLTDFQALSTSAITRSIFDGLPKPISGRRNKAALD
ncbi:hypothetical protein DM860_008139 [Cuscuta australis]|uniref:LysM domain-containing protein n=1 Tax=Cuscuta australis TaxID=267555 RepID=A0A328D6M7_9ASTE|nr:hypothetical protein DM860_008139 [Cuscuta australis]